MGWLALPEELDPDALAALDPLVEEPEEDEVIEFDIEVGLLREEPEIWDAPLRVALLDVVPLKEVDERNGEDNEEPPEDAVELPSNREGAEILEGVERELELPVVLAVVTAPSFDCEAVDWIIEPPVLEKPVLDDSVLVKLRLLGGPALQKLIVFSHMSSKSSPECATAVCDGFTTELPARIGKHEEHLLKYCWSIPSTSHIQV